MAERRLSVKEKLELQKRNAERKRNAQNSKNYRMRQKEKQQNVNHLIIFFGK
jgi:hypothetical protein